MATTPKSPAELHADDAARFTELVESATPGDWANPTPVAAWTALDVVQHLIEWSRGLLSAGGIELPPLDVDADPVAAWKQHVTDIQAILDEPAGRTLSNPNFGEKPVAEVLDEIYTADIWMHSWDLAKALGRDFELGDDRCTATLAAAAPMEEAMRGSGHFGPRVDVPADAGPQDQLLGFIGRDPAWRPS